MKVKYIGGLHTAKMKFWAQASPHVFWAKNLQEICIIKSEFIYWELNLLWSLIEFNFM